jgi:hypothetical protein
MILKRSRFSSIIALSVASLLALVTLTSAAQANGQEDHLAAGGLKVDITWTSGFSTYYKNKLEQAAGLIETAINSEAFRERVLANTFDGQVQFADNQGLSNEEIYQKIVEAKEVFNDSGDQVIEMHLKSWSPFNFWTSAVASTNMSSGLVRLRKKYYKSASLPRLANTMLHEWTHTIGFTHDFYGTNARENSVPYRVGDIIEEIIREQSNQ